ncbi:Fc.00g080670.m01.CDS01 [Cosmosporella sp. VM-42]
MEEPDASVQGPKDDAWQQQVMQTHSSVSSASSVKLSDLSISLPTGDLSQPNPPLNSVPPMTSTTTGDASEPTHQLEFREPQAAVASTTPENEAIMMLGAALLEEVHVVSGSASVDNLNAAEQRIEDEESLFCREPEPAITEQPLQQSEAEADTSDRRRPTFKFMGGCDGLSDEGSEFQMTSSPESDDVMTPCSGKRHGLSENASDTSPTLSPEAERIPLEKLIPMRDSLIVKRASSGVLTEVEEMQLQQLEALIQLAKSSQKVHDNPDAESGDDSDSSLSDMPPGDERLLPQTLAKGTMYATSEPRRRRKPAKNAREYVARLHEAEDEKEEERKRKHEDDTGETRKSRKVRVGFQRKGKAAENETRRQRAELFESINDVETSIIDGTVPTMASIQATTLVDQFAKIKANIPPECDTRRTRTQGKDLKEAARIFGNKKIKAVDGSWLLKGMKSKLRNYQLTAAAWMMKRELARSAPYGGLLADVMGMGKTVVSLACITGNPPEREDIENYSQATLVIVPNSPTAKQWQEEVRKHCDYPISTSVVRYSRSQNQPRQYFAGHWVVIATYYDVMGSFPARETIQELKDEYKEDPYSFETELNRKAGDLFQVPWYRVILDEAHAIKNRASRTALACWHLKAKYYWALSGTPLANSAEGLFPFTPIAGLVLTGNATEFYPYVKFLGCRFTKDLANYRAKYMADDSAKDNFEALACLIMYRRTMKDKFLGHRILPLPDSNCQDIWISLSEEETQLYTVFNDYYDRALSALRAKLKHELSHGMSGAPTQAAIQETNRSRYMKMRQIVSHPFNMEKMFRQRLRKDDIEAIEKRLHLQVGMGIPLAKQLKADETFSNGLSKYAQGLQIVEMMPEPVFGGNFNMNALMTMVANELDVKHVSCPKCEKSPPLEPVKSTDCGHIYCSRCLVGMVSSGIRGSVPGLENLRLICRVEACSAQLSVGENVHTLNCVQHDAAFDQFKEPGSDSNNIHLHREAEENGFFLACHREPEVQLPPSSKLTAAMAVALAWLGQAPDDKIIIFTQFVMTGKVLGRMLELADIPFVYFFGCMSPRQKEKAIDEFKENKEKKIFLASLKTGGQSLNLTVANRVILIDPWWNKTLEAQAFGRVLRFGQDKISHLARIWTKTCIEDRIYDLQRSKAEEVDRALQDDGHIPVVPSASQLEKLFAPQDGD